MKISSIAHLSFAVFCFALSPDFYVDRYFQIRIGEILQFNRIIAVFRQTGEKIVDSFRHFGVFDQSDGNIFSAD
jgi:hypothetical protein